MANHIPQKSNDALREIYKTQYGYYPSWLGAAFGWASQQTVFHIFDALYNFTDNFFAGAPWPIGIVEDAIKNVFQFAYNLLVGWAYCDWANQGDAIVKQFDATIADYTAKIQQVVDSANAELSQINGLINQAEQTLKDHEKRIKELETQMSPWLQLDFQKVFGKIG